MWFSTMLSLTGIAMSDAAAAWLMTSFDANPMAVSMVRVAASAPMFLLTFLAGALADIVEARRYLIVLESLITAMIVVFAGAIVLGWANAHVLLGATLLLSAGWALAAPAWLAIIPMLVPRSDLDGAMAANSVAYNISRAAGPCVAGLAIARLGASAPYWIFGVANFATLAALLWWRAPPIAGETLPAERLTSALRTGLRHACYNRQLRATLARTLAVYPFAVAILALLPLVARMRMDQGPEFYGVLMGAASAGAIGVSFAVRRLKAWMGADRLVAAGTAGIAAALVMLGLAREPMLAMVAAPLAGASWTVTLSTLNVSAQLALPDWVRARGLAIFLTVIFGCMAVGSAVWGQIAVALGVPAAMFAAAAGALIAIPLTWRWKLQAAAGVDLSPAMHWPSLNLPRQVQDNSGPVLVTLKYHLSGADPAPFLATIDEIGRQRRRDGAYAWGIFEDVAEKGVFLETFLIESWLEAKHLRERVTNADRLVEEHVLELVKGRPDLTLLLASDPRRAPIETRAMAA
jgi:MFS family permease